MSLDQTQNFVRVDVSGTHTDTETTISLESGEASNLPDPANGEYNLTWWDDSTYVTPTTDPEVEIVRVTDRDTTNDTITVQRGQENTTAVAHDTSGVQYRMILAATAKMFSDITSGNLDSNSIGTDVLDESAGFQFTSAIGVDDGVDIDFGTNDDAAIRFDSGNDRLEIVDQGVPEDVLRLPMNGSGDVSIPQRNLDMGANAIQNVGNVDGVDVSNHSTRHEENGSDELFAENLGTASTDTSQVLKPDGGGGVQFASDTKTGMGWTKDGEIDLSSSTTYSMNSNYDIVMLKCQAMQSSSNQIRFRINGDSGSNYDERRESGTTTTGKSWLRIHSGFSGTAYTYNGLLLMSGRWSQDFTCKPLGNVDNTIGIYNGCRNTGASSPLNQIEFNSASGSMSGVVEVYGANV